MTDDVKPEPTNVERLTTALVWSFINLETPGGIPAPMAKQLATLLDGVGVVASEPVNDLPVPSWLTERVREESQPVPVEPDHHVERDTGRVAKAPKRPKSIPKASRGVIL